MAQFGKILLANYFIIVCLTGLISIESQPKKIGVVVVVVIGVVVVHVVVVVFPVVDPIFKVWLKSGYSNMRCSCY